MLHVVWVWKSKMFRSCAQCCSIFPYHWWTALIKPKFPFSSRLPDDFFHTDYNNNYQLVKLVFKLNVIHLFSCWDVFAVVCFPFLILIHNLSDIDPNQKKWFSILNLMLKQGNASCQGLVLRRYLYFVYKLSMCLRTYSIFRSTFIHN